MTTVSIAHSNCILFYREISRHLKLRIVSMRSQTILLFEAIVNIQTVTSHRIIELY